MKNKPPNTSKVLIYRSIELPSLQTNISHPKHVWRWFSFSQRWDMDSLPGRYCVTTITRWDHHFQSSGHKPPVCSVHPGKISSFWCVFVNPVKMRGKRVLTVRPVRLLKRAIITDCHRLSIANVVLMAALICTIKTWAMKKGPLVVFGV